MANSEQLRILRRGSQPWNAWRAEHPDLKPDFTGADLRGESLNGADLGEADLGGAHLGEADLTGADLIGADLGGAKLTKAHLTGARLNGADLGGARLTGAKLIGAHLRRADLTGAKLTGADLTGANLSEANLSEADLTGAHLYQANLIETKLGGAHLRRAILGSTLFVKSSLAGTQGLDSAVHRGPSTLDHETFSNSKDLPLVFLQGIGLPDWLIDSYQGYLGSTIQFYSCFISYSHDDQSFARRVHDALQGRGIRCWLDEKQLLPGDDMHEEVAQGIRLWDKVLLCCSERSLTSWWVNKELKTAFKKEERLTTERREALQGRTVLALIPLNLDGYLLSGRWQSGMSEQVTSRLAADFTGWEQDNAKFEAQLERVVSALTLDDRGRERPPSTKL